MDAIPIWGVLVLTVVTVLVATEVGYRVGRRAAKRSDASELTPATSMVAAVLGLLAFMLAFTFGMVGSRFDTRKELLREEANVIRTTWIRCDFLPDAERRESEALIAEYVDIRVSLGTSPTHEALSRALTESVRIQHRLWTIAVAAGRRDPGSSVVALYVESLNRLFDLHALRVVVTLESRIPGAIWLALYALMALAMLGAGYQGAVAGSKERSWSRLIVAVAFSLVIALIVTLDRPGAGFITVSQQPLRDARDWIRAGAALAPAP